jgi:hypothetical protein
MLTIKASNITETRITQDWEPWILFCMLEAVEQTSIQTTAIIRGISNDGYKKKCTQNLFSRFD